MLANWNFLTLARITVETLTPLSIQTGQAQQTYDTSLVRDANGLPALPATSIRGVLRHLYQDQHTAELTDQLFGRGGNNDESQISRLQVSWGTIHNRANKPVSPHTIIDGQDPLLDELFQAQPITRDRVRLNHFGAAEDQGKFDITACPTGARFSFEIKLWSEQDNDPAWQTLVHLLSQPEFRLGHSTRSGFGALKVVAFEQHAFDMTQPSDAQAWQKLPRHIEVKTPTKLQSTDTQTNDSQIIKVNLKAEDFVRIGGGDIAVHTSNEPTDLKMQSEQRIVWSDKQTGTLTSEKAPIIPASAIKGALAHRLIYHSNRLQGQYCDTTSDKTLAQMAERSDHQNLIELLGISADSSNPEQSGRAGQLLINDIYLAKDLPTMQLWHNKIDRFTGGVVDGALYSEEVLYEPEVSFEITVTRYSELDQIAKEAFKATLDDLCEGLLPLGAGGSRGLGSFTGHHTLADTPLSQGEH